MISQEAKLLMMLKRNKRRGVANYEFPANRILRYSARIGDLRKDGYIITCVRDRLPNGKASNVFRYFLIDEDDKPSLMDRFKKAIAS